MPEDLDTSVQAMCQQLPAAETEISCGGIHQLDKFVLRRVARSIAIGIARETVRRICQKFVN